MKLYKDIIRAIFDNDNKRLKKLLVDCDPKLYEFHEGCVTHLALKSGNIEAAKILILASIDVDNKILEDQES